MVGEVCSMAHRRWARTISVMLALVLWLCLGLALPIVLGLYSSDRVSDALEAAPADAFSISQPVMLSHSPLIRLERGSVTFLDGNGKTLSAAGGNGGSSAATQNIKLFNALISFGTPDGRKAAGELAAPTQTSPFVEALVGGRYEVLSLRRTTILLHGLFEGAEALSDVTAELSTRRRGIVALKGTGKWRGQPVTIDAAANVAQAERRGALLHRVPLKLALKGEHIDVSFDGRMMSTPDEVELQGQGEVALPSGRRLARWLGAYWPSGPGLRDLSVKGQFKFTRHVLAFDKAVARMDGNEATGVLNLRLRQPRPLLTGTLAFASFDTKPYLTSQAVDGSEPFSWSSLAAGTLTVPLGMHLDTDLRISSEKVQLGSFEFGKVAASIALKDGRLLADIANLKFNGGEGGGQITADFSGFTPKVTVRGKLEQVDLGMMSGSLIGAQLLQGRGNIVADLVGAGVAVQDVIRTLSGKVAVRSQSPGKIGIDLKALAASARDAETTGWGAATRGSTAFDSLELRLVLRDSTMLAEAAESRSSEAAWSAVGVINLLSDRIDLRINQSAPGANVSGPILAPQAVIELHGPLQAPRVKASAGP